MERCPARRFSGIGNGADVLASEAVRVEVALPLVRVLLFGLWLELAALIAVVIHRGPSIGLCMQSALRQQDAVSTRPDYSGRQGALASGFQCGWQLTGNSSLRRSLPRGDV